MVDDSLEASTPTPRRGRPVSEHRRSAILQAATTLFLKEGFDGTSIEAIATMANVSKPTVYSHFSDKNTLFSAVVSNARSLIPAAPTTPSGTLLDTQDIEGSLVAVGHWFVNMLLEPRIAALRRLAVFEIARRPELETLWNRGEPDQFKSVLSHELGELHRAGLLNVPDTKTAVGQLISLWAHQTNEQSLYGMRPLPTHDVNRIVVTTAKLFVTAHPAH